MQNPQLVDRIAPPPRSATDGVNQPEYFRYWGKALPKEDSALGYHLLPFHCLDVAACGEALLRIPRFSLAPLAKDLGWAVAEVERLFVYFLVLHDLGKFARAFQGLAPNLSPKLVTCDRHKRYTQRHDTIGWLVWRDHLADALPSESLPNASHDFWGEWIRTSVGHHGMPPRDAEEDGYTGLSARTFCLPEDFQAATQLAIDAAAFLLSQPPPRPDAGQERILRRHSWRLAGLAVLADWLGSNQHYFQYHDHPRSLPEYWQDIARPNAAESVHGAGLAGHPPNPWSGAGALFDNIAHLTPLQQYAAEVELDEGPQLFLLEDVTGAGKTEAALILVQRLMSDGHAQGLYFALPSMATANQMYRRVGEVYQRLYQSSASPSLILAHGARQLVEGFRQSVLQAAEQPHDRDYRSGEGTATTQCNAWLADNRKKALLADVGVGTLDQALLSVLPTRHQSLRLLGLAGKVLVVDEVHAYDTYMGALLSALLTAHARQGGSVILLSATLPANQRASLVAAFQLGCDGPSAALPPDHRYPLATQVGADVHSHACATRAQLVRRVSVVPIHDEADVLALIASHAAVGRCVCWIRNTVDDARRAYAALSNTCPDAQVLLFHSRYAMGHRLDIEKLTLDRFGKDSTAAARQGQVLIATQVVEQSLDLDFDVLISDLAPIDLLIQRAGRLQRHQRDANGNPSADSDGRAKPVLYLFGPKPDEDPKADWYAASFPKAQYVYPNIAQLWLTQRALLAVGCIISPGEPGERGSVRDLVESVYGEDTHPVPEALHKAMRDQEGKDLAEYSQAKFNALSLLKGYCHDSSARWYEDTRVPTRLGDESLTIYLAREGPDGLQPFLEAREFAWEHSTVRIDARAMSTLAPDWRARFSVAIESLRRRYRLLADPAFVLPLTQEGAGWMGYCSDSKNRVRRVLYDVRIGLTIEKGE